MSLSPPSAMSHCLLGFAYALNDAFQSAADEFQSALSFDRHNQFALEMLKNVMDQIAKFPLWPFSGSESESEDEGTRLDASPTSYYCLGKDEKETKKQTQTANESLRLSLYGQQTETDGSARGKWATPTNVMSSTPNFAPLPVNNRTRVPSRLGPSSTRNTVRLDFHSLETSLEEESTELPTTSQANPDETTELDETRKSHDDMSIDDE